MPITHTLTARELATQFDLSPQQIQKLARAGKFKPKPIKKGPMWLFAPGTVAIASAKGPRSRAAKGAK